MDRNTVIGFVLLALLFFGYFYYTSQGQIGFGKTKTTYTGFYRTGYIQKLIAAANTTAYRQILHCTRILLQL